MARKRLLGSGEAGGILKDGTNDWVFEFLMIDAREERLASAWRRTRSAVSACCSGVVGVVTGLNDAKGRFGPE